MAFELFKRNKPQPKVYGNPTTGASAGQTGAQSQDRKETQDIAAVLNTVRFNQSADITGRITQEQMDRYRGAISGMTMQMENAKIIRLDAHEINACIKAMAESLPGALRGGNADTVDRILRGLAYGITQARQDIPEKDMDRAADIVERRVRRLNMYRDIIDLSGKIDELSQSVRQQEKKLGQYQEVFAQCKADLKRVCDSRPDLVRELEELGFGSNQLSAGAKGIDTARVKVLQLSDSIENLAPQNSTDEEAMAGHMATIRSLENQMTQSNALVDEQTLEDIRKQQEAFQQDILRLERQIDEMERVNKDFTRAMDAVYSSPEMVDRIIRHAMEWEAFEKKEKAKEEGIREGQKNTAENEQTTGRILNY